MSSLPIWLQETVSFLFKIDIYLFKEQNIRETFISYDDL